MPVRARGPREGERPVRAHVFVEQDMQQPARVPCDTAEVWAYSRRAPDKTSSNEDAAGVWERDDGGLVLAVADGVGGMPSGAEAAACAVAAVGDCLDGAPRRADLRPLLLDAFDHANRAVQDLGVGAGTTLVVTQLVGNQLRTYHVGDSEALLVGQRGRLKLATIPHSPVGYGVAAGLIDPESALTHDDRHYLSNHLGTHDMHIEVGSERLVADRDTLLMASDGLFDNLAPTEIVEAIRRGPLGSAAARLARTCLERMSAGSEAAPGKPDDTTFLLCRRRRR